MSAFGVACAESISLESARCSTAWYLPARGRFPRLGRLFHQRAKVVFVLDLFCKMLWISHSYRALGQYRHISAPVPIANIHERNSSFGLHLSSVSLCFVAEFVNHQSLHQHLLHLALLALSSQLAKPFGKHHRNSDLSSSLAQHRRHPVISSRSFGFALRACPPRIDSRV